MDIVFLLIVGLFGLSIGSFLNVVIDRLSEGRTLLGRSMCDFCKRVLSPLELIPVLSFLLQKGYAKCCGKKLSWQYPAVELITGVIFVIIWQEIFLKSGDLIMTFSLFGSAAALIVIVFADLRYRIIPDAALAALAVIKTSQLYFSLANAPFAHNISAGFILFAAMGLLFAATRGRGIGFGDVKFAGIIGYMLGLQDGFLALYIAFITGGLVAIGLLLTSKKGLKSEVPFGPFMVWGLVIAAIFNEQLITIFSSLF